MAGAIRFATRLRRIKLFRAQPMVERKVARLTSSWCTGAGIWKDSGAPAYDAVWYLPCARIIGMVIVRWLDALEVIQCWLLGCAGYSEKLLK